jgi:hypothetical protein
MLFTLQEANRQQNKQLDYMNNQDNRSFSKVTPILTDINKEDIGNLKTQALAGNLLEDQRNQTTFQNTYTANSAALSFGNYLNELKQDDKNSNKENTSITDVLYGNTNTPLYIKNKDGYVMAPLYTYIPLDNQIHKNKLKTEYSNEKTYQEIKINKFEKNILIILIICLLSIFVCRQNQKK